MEIEVNLNDRVLFKPTERGKKKFGIETDSNGYADMQLWEFMNKFGPTLYAPMIPSTHVKPTIKIIRDDKYLKLPFETNQEVIDTLTGEKCKVIGIKYEHGHVRGDKKCSNYHCWGIWIDNDYLGGGRHPWEIIEVNEFVRRPENTKICWLREQHPELCPDNKLTEAVGEDSETKVVEEKQVRKVMYAIGQDDNQGGIGVWYGPNPSEKEVLDIPGRDNNSVIVRFNPDCSDEIKWRWRNDHWDLDKRFVYMHRFKRD